MTHYGICSDDKCYAEVYTKEEVNVMLNDKVGTVTQIGQFDLVEGQSHAEVVVNLTGAHAVPGLPLGVIGFKMTGGFENCIIVDTFYVEYASSGWRVRLGAHNTSNDPYNHVPFEFTILYAKQYE